MLKVIWLRLARLQQPATSLSLFSPEAVQTTGTVAAVVVSVAETPGQDFGRHGRERRAQANRCRSVESGL